VDRFGQAHLTGITSSTNFPTRHPLRATLSGGADAFVTKLQAAGDALVYSTYLGGTADDVGIAVAVDRCDDAYVTGHTESADFPTRKAFQATKAAGFDAFVSKLGPGGRPLIYSSFLGGSDDDFSDGIAVDRRGNAYVTGTTSSTDFPTRNPFQSTKRGSSDSFVTKIGPKCRHHECGDEQEGDCDDHDRDDADDD
jgi:hypothetical protein